MLDFCLLGTGGMQPMPGRRLSAGLVRVGSSTVLLDCGEGTQVAVREAGWGLRNIRAILLTHLHADHVLGLPGLLLTLANTERGEDEPLLICGPEPLVPVLQGLLVAVPNLPFPVEVGVLTSGDTFSLPEMEQLQISCVEVDHEITCLAYALHVPRTPRFDPDRARALGVPLPLWRRLQQGETVTVDNRTITPAEVLGAERRGIRIVFATDTRPAPALTRFVAAYGGADLLIADGMYGDDADKPRKWKVQHMSFAEAAATARDGGARRLILTHFSPALTQPRQYLDRATAVFPHSEVGEDLMKLTLRFED